MGGGTATLLTRYADEGAGLIGAVVGAIIVLVIWGMVAPRDRLRT